MSEENANNVTAVRPFLVKVTQASGHQFEIEECAHIQVVLGPDLDIAITTNAMGIQWKPTGCESMSAAYSWIRIIMAMIRGRFREDA